MKKLTNVLVLAVVFALLGSTSAVAAKPEGFKLPAKALEVSNGVFSLGKHYDVVSDSLVEGYAIVHKKEKAKGGAAAAKPPKGGTTCYGFLGVGAKWKNVEAWEVFAGEGLTEAFMLGRVTGDIAKWETAAGTTNILGSGSVGLGAITDPYILDDKNQVSFGELENGTIAVTVVWGNFSGPVQNRVLVAWDQIYNTLYDWSATGEALKMDFENISTHELGHAMGMADIYTSSCSSVSMYGYATEGETSKRSLEKADRDGINVLY